ncbi:ABC transporter permease [Promicromonospora kroppenstedtii]|uniref:ABC transporter permease n=1 Tax=Promicromonospora kroppenstedtii TaxID=440482 RepID=A0ABW7XRW5_9MICO
MSAAVATPSARELAGPVFGSTLAGTGKLLRFMLRRDRMRIFWWALGVTLLYAGGLGEYVLLDDPAASEARSVLVSSPAMISMTGPGYGLDHYTPGAAVANEFILWLVLTLAVMSILQVVRHTRSEEESSRSELVRAGVVGRHAPSVAALLLVLIMNVIIALTSAVAVAAQDFDVAQSFAMTFAIALGALVFGAVALVAAQAYEHGRGAVGLSLAALGAAFLLRALGDVQGEHGSALSWLSPIAWVQQTRVFVDLRWWPLGLCVAAIVLLLVLAALLGSRRDFGAGLVAVRSGRADAEPTLAGPAALAWVQQRGALLWTTAGLGVMWLGSGTIIREVPNMLDAVQGNPMYAALLGSGEDMVRTFLGIFGLYIAAGAAAYGIAATLRVKGEEESGRTEIVLAAPVSRGRWLAAPLLVAFLGTVVVQITGALALWLGAASTGYDELAFGEYLELGLAYLPALAVLVGLAAALYAWLPRATGLAWVMIGYVFLVGMFADLFDLPEWARKISPFWWVGNPALADVEAARLWGLSGVAVVLLALAFAGFRRRDVPIV